MTGRGGALGSDWLKLAILLVGLAVVVVTLAVRGFPSLEEIRAAVDGAGAWAPVLFVLLFAGATLALLPVTLFALSAGVLFGPVTGVALVWLGAMLGASACFAVGRSLSRPAVRRLTASGRAAAPAARAEQLLARRGIVAVLVLRLLPVVPFGPSSYLAGATGLSVRDYVVGTGVGIVPGIVVYTVLGGTADDPSSPAFLASAAALVLLLVVTGVLSHRSTR